MALTGVFGYLVRRRDSPEMQAIATVRKIK
jgi:hypothetical protein